MFSQADLEQIKSKGIPFPVIEQQLLKFIEGFPPVRLIRPAILSDGIIAFSQAELKDYADHFDRLTGRFSLLKFVPASGAASRMFKHLFEFIEHYSNADATEILSLIDDRGSVGYFFKHIHEFAFYNDLERMASNREKTLQDLLTDRPAEAIRLLLERSGLAYASLPKGLLKFHKYPDGARTAAEEHLIEAANYACNQNKVARIHFTISPEHQKKFIDLFTEVQDYYQSLFGLEFEITYSIQKPSTDTIAVDENNRPFRTTDGHLLFRPGGHGALLENLNDINADIIFVKNIDNVVPDFLKEPTIQYKRVLGGYLMTLKELIDEGLEKLARKECSPKELEFYRDFAQTKLQQDINTSFDGMTSDEKSQFLFNLLNRPIRICGMVRNEGEPGGGPFWVADKNDNISLQIVESSQVNFKDPLQKEIFSKSTHFNPVDLVCAIKDFTGKKFDLHQFVDESTGFISIKSSGGQILKAQELPGLWNGAMANWITIFAEVPVITFNPVKTINDLLRDEHRSGK